MQQIFAQESQIVHTKLDTKSQVSNESGISDKLLSETFEKVSYPGTYFAFGIYQDYLVKQSQNEFSTDGFGVDLGFYQQIKEMWSGGIEVRWSDWKFKNNQDQLSPFGIFSKINMMPKLTKIIPNIFFQKVFRPYLTGGLGYIIFFNDRNLLSPRSKTELGQLAVTYGGGISVILPASFSFKLGFEQWRGVQNTVYVSNSLLFQINFGDMEKF